MSNEPNTVAGASARTRSFPGRPAKFRPIWILCLVLSYPPVASAVDVFMATGQSNAHSEWTRGIEDTLRASGAFPDMRMIWVRRSGKALGNWFDNAPGDLYRRDFFSTDPLEPGLLQQVMEDSGPDARFRALFWFQGESDAYPDGEANYVKRFEGMLDRISTDLGAETPFAESGMRYHLALVDSSLPQLDLSAIRQIQQGMTVKHAAFAGMVDTRNFLRRDGLHLHAEACYLLGRQMGNQYLVSVGAPEVPLDCHWIGLGNDAWENHANWTDNRIPDGDPIKRHACFGRIPGNPGSNIVSISAPAGIDGLNFDSSGGIGYWRLRGPGTLSVADDIDVRHAALEIECRLDGRVSMTGRGGLVMLTGVIAGNGFHAGSHGSPGMVYEFRRAGQLDQVTGFINLGKPRIAGNGETDLRVEASQDVSALTRVFSGRPGDTAQLVIRNGAIWRQGGMRPFVIGMSNSNGNHSSEGRVRIGGGPGDPGTLIVSKHSAFEVGTLAGTGHLTIANGSLVLEGSPGELAILGGATYRADSARGGEGSGTIRIEHDGILQTSRGFRSGVIHSPQGLFQGSGWVRMSGGVLRIAQPPGGPSQTLDLFGGAAGSPGGVRLELLDGPCAIDTGGNDVIIHTPVSGNGTLVKTGQGALRFTTTTMPAGGLKMEAGSLEFDGPLHIPRNSRVLVAGGMLRAHSILNEGLLEVTGNARLWIENGIVNEGTYDTTEWKTMGFPRLLNRGEWRYVPFHPQVLAGMKGDRFHMTLPGLRNRFYRLQLWEPDLAQWIDDGPWIPGMDDDIEVEIPLRTGSSIYRFKILEP